jgi:hypothetical protein
MTEYTVSMAYAIHPKPHHYAHKNAPAIAIAHNAPTTTRLVTLLTKPAEFADKNKSPAQIIAPVIPIARNAQIKKLIAIKVVVAQSLFPPAHRLVRYTPIVPVVQVATCSVSMANAALFPTTAPQIAQSTKIVRDVLMG